MKVTIDRRVRYTKMVLRDSILDLLRNKSLNEISITELCKAADLNRNTFYKHYNTPYEIIREMEDEMFTALMDSIKDFDNVNDIILASCRTMERDKKMSVIIFSETDSSSLLSKALSSFRKTDITAQMNSGAILQQSLQDKLYLFGEQGTIALMKDWVLGGFQESAESIAEIISHLIQSINGAGESFKSKSL
ncbi:TetR/AcrR family transcriptional regulator [Flavobacterium sp. KBS0721]|uniref:TetR/AcrR family transcriptional regulator n=1 Tax=Flavobacterium sp. KBS0721 TaxID=1179672 RepID=UPI000990155D|nr:TetR/AcrR family transcriptional regulator [Flavobacterium sp. KBS0721]QDW21619.1 TetR/AcrR family transcriptional regulator [Flavobacterium sp. KBS0721]